MVGEADAFFVVGGSQLVIKGVPPTLPPTNPSTNTYPAPLREGVFWLPKLGTEASSCRPGGHACGAVPGSFRGREEFLVRRGWL